MFPAPSAGPHLRVAGYGVHGSAAVLEGSGVMVLGCENSRSAAELLGRRHLHSISISSLAGLLQSDGVFAVHVELYKQRAQIPIFADLRNSENTCKVRNRKGLSGVYCYNFLSNQKNLIKRYHFRGLHIVILIW